MIYSDAEKIAHFNSPGTLNLINRRRYSYEFKRKRKDCVLKALIINGQLVVLLGHQTARPVASLAEICRQALEQK